MNSINLTGNICNDLELKQTTTGKSVLNFYIAVKRPYSKDTTDFIPVVAYEQSAEYLSKYAHKGAKIALSGKLTTRKWEDKDGTKRTTYEVVADVVEICESAKSNTEAKSQPAEASQYIPSAYTQPKMNTPTAPQFEDMSTDGDLPF